tara:strand:+ start:14269 stop:17295 length:3027 start_codon:yes stop_codon:yes gene_type:complete
MIRGILAFGLIGFVFGQFDWEESGMAVRQGAHIEWQRTATVGNDGEVIVVWSDTRFGGRDVYAQKMDNEGNFLWEESGVAVVSAVGRQEDPLAVSDGQGGAYIIWVDYRDEPENGDVYGQHLLSNGTIAWNPSGIPLSNVLGVQESPNLCIDGQGGAFAIWNDRSPSSGMAGFIYATHLSPDGSVLAQGTGISVIRNDISRGSVSLEVGGTGYANMVWDDSREGEKNNIYGQRMNTSCETLWSTPEEGGIPLNESPDDQIAPRVTYLSGDTSVVVWEDYRNNSLSGDVYVQFIVGDGSLLLGTEGIPLCTDSSKQSIPRVKADESTAYVVWEDFRNHSENPDIFANAVTPEGTVLWGSDGKPISTESRKQTGPRLTPDGVGGVYIVWKDEHTASFPETEIFLQRVSASGEISFPENGLAVCEAPSHQFGPIVRKDSDGGSFVVWGDTRTGSIGINLQHVDQSIGNTLEQDGIEVFWGVDGNSYFPESVRIDDEQTLIYWKDERKGSSYSQIYGQIINSNFSNMELINGTVLSERPGQIEPTVVKAGNHLFLQFNGENDEGTRIQYYQILDLDLNMVGDTNGTVIYENLATQNQEFSVVTTGNDGFVYVAFSDTRWYDLDIYVQKYSEIGEPQWQEGGIAVGALEADDVIESIVPGPDEGCIIVWANGSWLGIDLYAQAIDGSGNTRDGWSEVATVISNWNSDQSNSQLHTTNDGIFILWEDKRDGSMDLYGQFVTYDGTITGTDGGFPVTAKMNDQYEASMDYNQYTETIFIAWQDFEAGIDFDIFGRLLNLSDLSLNDEIIIAQDSLDQLAPDVHVNNSGDFMVVWEDARNGGVLDIYYQEITPAGFSYEDGGTVVCDMPFAQQWSKINKYRESNDSYVIYWEDMRSTGKAELHNIYSQSISFETESVGENNHYPAGFSLDQNYPNPFNAQTTIPFQLPFTENVKMTVYNLLGQEVKTVLNEISPAGFSAVQWNGKNTSGQNVHSGVYFVKLKAGSFSEVKKVLLIK